MPLAKAYEKALKAKKEVLRDIQWNGMERNGKENKGKERKEGRKKETNDRSYLLIHSPHARGDQGWARTKSGGGDSFQVSWVGSRNSIT